MKITKRFLLTLVAILGLTGAWAQDTEEEVTVTAKANATNEWTLTMPASNVEVRVKYRNLSYAEVTTAPAPVAGLVYNGEAQTLIAAGTATGGTLHYGLGTAEAAPTDDGDWSTDLPTATDGGTYYVWYKVVGDDTHHGILGTSPVAVTIEPTFAALLAVTGNNGTACSAWLMNASYGKLTANDKMKAGDKFVLCVDKADDYDFNVSLSKGDLEATEFSLDEYEAYLAYARENNIAVPMNTTMAWVTAPRVETGDLTVTVAFQKQKTFTVLYQPQAASDEVWCRIGINNALTGMRYDVAKMKSDSEIGGTTVWSVKASAAYDPAQVAFFTSEEAARTDGATMSNAVVSQSANQWTNISGGQYVMIGGNAKTVVAAFVADGSTVPMYDSQTISLDGDMNSNAVRYQIAVCQTDADGNVTAPGTIAALSAPANAPEGKVFDAWSALMGTAPGKTDTRYSAGQTGISISENTIFRAVWKPLTLTATLNLNGGSGLGTTNSVSYNDLLNLGKPSRQGFAFDGWTVSQSVSQSNELFVKGAPFDFGTPITADLGLTAQWKHVHEYHNFQISDFPTALAAYQKYNSIVHVAICGCDDVELVAHSFGANGKCACGLTDPTLPKPVTLDVSYGQWAGGTYTEKMLGFPQTVQQEQEVSISAPHNYGQLEFQKWQYSTGGQWYDLTSYEIVSFIIPCDMKVRALYVNPITAPQVELSARHYDDQAQVNGQTYTMDNVLYQMNYQLPDGYKFVDAGIRMGDNSGISYYELKERTYTMDAEAKAIGVGICTLVSILNTDITTFDASASEKYYAERENSVLDEMSASELAKYMYESKPVNVEKYPPIYWESKAQTKGLSGAVATLPPLRFIQKNNGNHYIYGIGYLKYKDAQGQTKTIYTDALATTRDNIPTASVTKTAGKAQGAPSRMMARKAPAESQTEDIDMRYVFAPETQLTVFVDGQWSATLSDRYGFGDQVTLEAPAVDGKTFSYWEADGQPVSSSQKLVLTMNANTTLRAVYGGEATNNAKAGFTSVTRNGSKISMQAIADPQATEAGIIYSTSLTGDALTLEANGATKVAAQTLTETSTQMPASVLDKNKNWMLQITPEDENTIYHARVYATVGGTTTYSDVRDVKLADLESGILKIANLGGFDEDITEALKEVKKNVVIKFDLTQAGGDDAHGTVTFTVDGAAATQAKKGDAVTASVTTDEGYSIKDVTIRAEIPELVGDIAVNKNETEGTWSFIMPEANVLAEVTFTRDLQADWIQPIPDQLFAGEALTPEVEVKDGETLLTLGTDYTVEYADNDVVGRGKVTVTGKGNYSGSATATFAIFADREDLIAAIDAAQQIWDDSLNVGTKVFEYPKSALNFLDDVIAQAAKVRDNTSASLAEVKAAIAELEKGVENYRNLPLNAPAEGQLFNLVLTDTEADCEQADKAVTYVAGTDGTYAVQYLAEANKNLAQAFTFTQVEGNNYTLSQIDADGVARYLCTDADGNIATTTDAAQAMLVTVVPSQTQQGVYSLRNVAANQFIGSQDIDVSTVDQNNNFLLVETEKPAVSVNTTEAGWGTVMFPFAVASLPEGVKAYTCDAVEGTTLTLVEVEALEANRPYIVEGAWKATLTGDAQGTALEYTAGLLTGVYADTEAPAASYVLQNQNGNVAFYLVEEAASQPTVGAYHAYLTVDSSVKAFGLGEGETAIRSLQADGEGSVIYNLSGQRVQKTQRGIYVVNGKKVVRK